MTNLGASLLYYTTRLDEVVADLAKHHLNTLYPCVWSRGNTLHPSSVIRRARRSPRDFGSLPFQDVLSGLVHQAHRQHLRVIPWFEYGLMIPVRSSIAQRHPDWLTTTQSGATSLGSVEQAFPLPKLLGALKETIFGIEQAWLNPLHPEVQQFLTQLIVDVVKRYPVDGIQLDDHFSLPIEFGYDSYTVKLYRAAHQGDLPPSDATDSEWMAWRAERLTQLMSKISKAVKTVRPDLIVSLSPNAPDYAYRKSLQDWRRWVKLGLVDEVVVQVYRSDLDSLRTELEDGGFRDLRSQIPIGIGLYTGPSPNAKPIQQLREEVEAVRSNQYAGVSFFCWETTLGWFRKSSQAQVLQGFAQLFSSAAKR